MATKKAGKAAGSKKGKTAVEPMAEALIGKNLTGGADSASLPATDGVGSEKASAMPVDPPKETKKMATLTLRGLDKRGRNGIYAGGPVLIRIPLAAFENKTAPETTEISGVVGGPRPKRQAETPEERKARLAARPKPTPAEKVALLEKQLEKMRRKAQAQSTEQTEQAAELQPAL